MSSKDSAKAIALCITQGATLRLGTWHFKTGWPINVAFQHLHTMFLTVLSCFADPPVSPKCVVTFHVSLLFIASV